MPLPPGGGREICGGYRDPLMRHALRRLRVRGAALAGPPRCAQLLRCHRIDLEGLRIDHDAVELRRELRAHVALAHVVANLFDRPLERIAKASPGLSCATNTLALGKSLFHCPPMRSSTALPLPSRPPLSPHGRQCARSLWLLTTIFVRARTTRSTPSPPRPAPPESGTSA